MRALAVLAAAVLLALAAAALVLVTVDASPPPAQVLAGAKRFVRRATTMTYQVSESVSSPAGATQPGAVLVRRRSVRGTASLPDATDFSVSAGGAGAEYRVVRAGSGVWVRSARPASSVLAAGWVHASSFPALELALLQAASGAVGSGAGGGAVGSGAGAGAAGSGAGVGAVGSGAGVGAVGSGAGVGAAGSGVAAGVPSQADVAQAVLLDEVSSGTALPLLVANARAPRRHGSTVRTLDVSFDPTAVVGPGGGVDALSGQLVVDAAGHPTRLVVTMQAGQTTIDLRYDVSWGGAVTISPPAASEVVASA